MKKTFYVVSYKQNNKTIYYTDKKETDLFSYETSDIFEAKRYTTYKKALNYVNNKKKHPVGLNPITDFEIHEIEITINELNVTKV